MADELKHIQPYDPVKAHEYYLRTRHLKGRKAGVKLQPTPKGTGAKPNASNAPKLAVVKPQPHKTPEQQKAEVAARVAHLKERLAHLRKVFEELIKQFNKSQGRTVVDSKGRAVGNHQTVKKQSSAGSTKLTTAQKRDAATASKRYRQTHKQQLDRKAQEARLNEQIKGVEDKIRFTRAALKASVVNARKTVKNRQQLGA